MRDNGFGWQGFGLRFLAAVLLVFATYNPEGFSYFHWAVRHLPEVTALKAFAGVVLLIGWAIFVRASLRSLGFVGLSLALAFFATLIWLVVDTGLIPAHSLRAVTYIVQAALAGVLTAGLSWSHIRRRLSGQIDADDVDQL
ncbi:MAG TPA: DUF6524 family protein [Gammaproteobacteria bacterium]|nr:DUF6524 family protein [Gammaproteobacteria bacterium]